MYVLIVTGSGLMKVNKLMLVQSASVVPSGCTPCTCNLCVTLLNQLRRELVVRSYSNTQPGVYVLARKKRLALNFI